MTTPVYQDILAQMAQLYTEQAGHSPDNASDIGIRLKVLASLLAELWQQLAEQQRQAFPESATGEFLDKHCAQRSLNRKQPLQATGVLRFSRQTPAGYDIIIPAGCVCQPAGEDTLRVETTCEALLPAGEVFIECPARTLEGGRRGNLVAGSINVLLSPPPGITGVTNPAAFTGGEDGESDEQLRSRLLQSFLHIPTGANCAYYWCEAMGFEGIASAAVLPLLRGPGTLDIVVSGAGYNPPPELLARLNEHFATVREVGVDTLVLPAQELPCGLELAIAPAEGVPFARLAPLVVQAVAGYAATLGVGQPLLRAALGRTLYDLPGLYNYEILQPEGDIHPLSGQVVRPGEAVVTEMAVV